MSRTTWNKLEMNTRNNKSNVDDSSTNSGEKILSNEKELNDEAVIEQQKQQPNPNSKQHHDQTSLLRPEQNNEVMLRYCIIEVSSEDPNYPASQLEQNFINNNGCSSDVSGRHSSKEGWVSEQNCAYPQYIIIQPLKDNKNLYQRKDNAIANKDNDDPSSDIFLEKIEMLSHNLKIPEKIEIYISTSTLASDNDNIPVTNNNVITSSDSTTITLPPSSDFIKNIKFQRLGYITFDDNVKTKYQARELKSISINAKATFIKFVIHACHGYDQINGRTKNDDSIKYKKGDQEVNPFNQVGIVSINLFRKKPDQSCQSNVTQVVIEEKTNRGAHITTSNTTRIIEEKERASIGTNTSIIDDIVKSTKMSYKISHHQHKSESRKTLTPMGPNDIVEFKSRVSKLELIMHKVAEKEDFDVAAKIKLNIVKINDALANLQKLQLDMRRAAESEDYVEASRLKAKRDKMRGIVIDALNDAEIGVDSSVLSHDNSSCHHQRIKEIRLKDDHLEDLSLSTIRRLDDDDPSIAMTMTGRSFQINVDDHPMISKEGSSSQSQEERITKRDVNASLKELSSSGEVSYDGEHPLQGTPNYENLPNPEELYHQSEGGLAMSLNSSSSLISMGSISKIESILGQYRTRCFFSKKWLLREAAILKLSLILPSTIKNFKENSKDELDWWNTFSRSLCIILEKALNDKIVQVFLSALILLDDFINEIEKFQISHKETISLLGNVVVILVDKISSGNQKVIEGTETALMSLALYDGIGPSYIGSQLMKQKPAKSSKGKLLNTRFRILREIVEEFGSDAPNAQKIMDFVKTYGFGHNDADVREVVKELTTAVFLRDGKIVMSMLDGLTERQLKEYKISFALAEQIRQNKDMTFQDTGNGSMKRALNTNGIESKLPILTPRGRGRGRGRHIQRKKTMIGLPYESIT